jgi:hypothetical protein
MDSGGRVKVSLPFNNGDYGVKPDGISFLRLDLFQKTVVGDSVSTFTLSVSTSTKSSRLFYPCARLLQPTKYRHAKRGMTTSLFIGTI